jgi:hypothetical protein
MAGDTTTGLLIKAGWKVLATRLMVRNVGSPFAPDGETLRLLKGSDRRDIDLHKMAEDIAAGKKFFADLTKPDSPFADVRAVRGSGSTAVPYNQLFDALVFLP